MSCKEQKECITCTTTKPLTAFEKRSDTGKYRNQCKDCRNTYVKQYKSDISSRTRQKNEVVVVNDMKICIVCKELKALDKFTKRNTEHGYRHDCKACRKESLSEYYEKVYNEVRRNRKQSDIEYRLMCNHRNYVYKCLTKYGNKKKSSLKYVGCTLSTLKSWIEYQFDKDMTWENYGTLWTVDHVLALDLFDLTDETQQKIAFNWKNMQPSKDNFIKNNKIRLYEYFNVLVL